MYCPSVLIMPCVPAPYRKMLTVPTKKKVSSSCQRYVMAKQGRQAHTKDKSHYNSNSCRMSVEKMGIFDEFLARLSILPPIMAPILTVKGLVSLSIINIIEQQYTMIRHTFVQVGRPMLTTSGDCCNRRHSSPIIQDQFEDSSTRPRDTGVKRRFERLTAVVSFLRYRDLSWEGC